MPQVAGPLHIMVAMLNVIHASESGVTLDQRGRMTGGAVTYPICMSCRRQLYAVCIRISSGFISVCEGKRSREFGGMHECSTHEPLSEQRQERTYTHEGMHVHACMDVCLYAAYPVISGRMQRVIQCPRLKSRPSAPPLHSLQITKLYVCLSLPQIIPCSTRPHGIQE